MIILLEVSVDIKDLKNKHKGGEIAILGNGLSLHKDIEDLKTDRITTIGVNSSWHHYNSTYQFCLDWEQLAEMVKANKKPKNVIVGEFDYKILVEGKAYALDTTSCYKVKMHFSKKLAFSTNVETGINVCMSSPWGALQMANYMLGGAGNVYLMGMDLGGPRVEGHPKKNWKTIYQDNRTRIDQKDFDLPPKSFLAQYELLGYLRHMIDSGSLGIKVFLSGNSQSLIRGIPKVPFLSRGKNPERLYEGSDDQLKMIPITKETMEWMKNASIPKRSTKSPE